MKKLLCLILCLMMILPAVPSLAADSGTCGNDGSCSCRTGYGGKDR